MKALKVLVISICAMVATVACSKKGGGSTAAAAVTYYMSNNICYDAKTNQSVATSNCNGLAYYLNGNTCMVTNGRTATDMANCHALVGQYYYVNNSCWDKNAGGYTNNTNCNTGTNGRYQWRNNVCTDTQTGYSVQDISLCNNNGNNSNDPRCQQRNRYLYTDRYGYTQYADCYNYSCSGMVMYDQQTRTHVTCQ